ncbi:AAC(3) family N-acetyltransferase [Kitasatospora phosalacinea]|uniref:AAC(3) family N-acetyltransferase n=1 Tax=Kitasatospora phosalacinea TaxID=2065 RepID=UPI0035D9F2D7
MTGTVVRPERAARTGRGRPWEVGELVGHLEELGVREGEVLLVQSSLRAVGPVTGGVQGVVKALLEALGARGTLVVYTATPENSRTSPHYRAATAGLTPAQLAGYHERMPVWDRALTAASPTMGRLAEEVRLLPGALRSAHPQTSFTAFGPAAAELTDGHRLECHLGDDSPAGWLYRNRARSLMLGVPVWCCTPLHLLEYWQPDRPEQVYTCVRRDGAGGREVVEFTGTRLRDDHFAAMGELLDAQLGAPLRHGPVGDARSHLMPIREAVDLAAKWYRNGRS